MGAITSAIIAVALSPHDGLGPSAIQCGFPAEFQDEPSISMDIATTSSLFAAPGTLPVHMELSTGANDMRMTGILQPLSVEQKPVLLVAGSPMVNIHFSVGLNGDGSASLTIRDARRGPDHVTEVIRLGSCQDHESFFMRYSAI